MSGEGGEGGTTENFSGWDVLNMFYQSSIGQSRMGAEPETKEKQCLADRGSGATLASDQGLALSGKDKEIILSHTRNDLPEPFCIVIRSKMNVWICRSIRTDLKYPLGNLRGYTFAGEHTS